MKFPTRMTFSARLTSAAIALIAFTGSLRAQTIHWGDALLDTLIKSDGSDITSSGNYQFQIGVFEEGFTPGAENTAAWIANWQTLDAAVFNEALGYFTSSFNVTVDPFSGQEGQPLLGMSDSPEAEPGARVAAGQQLWLMVYNNTNLDATTELFLGTAGTWSLPAVGANQMTMPVNFRLDEITLAPVFGGANELRGGGTFTDVPGGNYALQTATFIPEPGSGAMLLLSVAGLLRRRRSGGTV